MEDNINEQNGFILYLDVLGYRNIVNSNQSNVINVLKSVLISANEWAYKIWFKYSFNCDKNKCFIRSFSDNTIFFYPAEKNDFSCLNGFLALASQIQYAFLKSGFLVRGSLTYGTLLYNNDFIFGKDLVSVVELEEKHPEPSILLSNKIVDIIMKNKNSIIEGYENVKENNFIVPFNTHIDDLDLQDCVNGINKYLSFLNNCSNYEFSKIYKKINWIVDQMNNYFKLENRYCLKTSHSINLERQ